ncbi:MAG TPA: proprotein convertase P-domain-containing protein [Thermoanaerobaculia bacterium]|nr:proprotein convertase P-domain-containing protein [Thermoanaerobaculia bacterium]
MTLNDPSLMDNNDAPVPGHAYESVLLDLQSGTARLVDRQSPSTPLPDPNAPLMFDRADDRFEPVNAYFHVDKTQRYLQSLGYFGTRQLVAYPIEIDALALNGADASQFLPSMQIGRGTLYFGSGGTDDAEDGDIVVHEYGHAILEWIAPGTFGGGSFSTEARAIAEGFGDYLAFSSHYDARIASGRDPFCFADWDARCWTDAASEGCAYPVGADCLRRLDSGRTMADYSRGDTAGVEHRNGQIWSSALRELFLALGRRTTDVLVVESLFAPPPHPTFAVMARRLIETDRLLFGGEHAAAICAAMTKRGIGVSCDGTPRGELVHFPSLDRGLAIPELNPFGISSTIAVADTRAIQRLAVRVDIDHTARGDLRIELEAPDGRRVLLQNVSNDVTAGIHVTYGIDAASAEPLSALHGMSAAGTWRLHVADNRTRDTGTLQSWSLVFQFDDPRATRPRGATSQMIPVVAHLFGAGITPYTSDVHLANVTNREQTATLIFTRSHADGTTDFSAVDVRLAAGQSITLEDVVARTFFTTGSGSLEILGDVLATSRLGGQEVPVAEPARRHELAGVPEPGVRYNAGIVEVAGQRTRVLVNGRELVLEPFSHVQVASERVVVVEADVPVAAYLAQAGGDPMLLTRAVSGTAPGISADGWRSEFWNADTFQTDPLTPGTRGAFFVAGGMTRIVHGATTQFIPLRELDDRREQHLIALSSDATHRTNIGIVTDGSATAEVIVYDAKGNELERLLLVTQHGLAQLPATASFTGGRAIVRLIAGDRIRAYASVIDRRSGDAAFVDGQ